MAGFGWQAHLVRPQLDGATKHDGHNFAAPAAARQSAHRPSSSTTLSGVRGCRKLLRLPAPLTAACRAADRILWPLLAFNETQQHQHW